MIRLDQLLVQQGYCQSRAQAQRKIKEGLVELAAPEWQTATKPSTKLPVDTPLRVASDETDQYVSRGALKLKGALEQIELDITDFTAIDVGQSTGGFTDVLLQAGVKRVVGIEVGQDQLAQRLREDPRVVCLEKYNARALKQDLISYNEGDGFDLAVMDVSFISQRLILGGLAGLIKDGGYLISLVKPQFELGPEHIGKGGLVKSTDLYPKLEGEMKSFCLDLGLGTRAYIESPIKGGDGNREFILIARKDPPTQN